MPLFTTPVQPWMLNEAVRTGAASSVLVANTVYLYAIELYAAVSVPSMKVRMGATVTGTVDLGIYDSGGNLLGHTGATTPGTNVVSTINLTATLALSPGRYFLAACPSNSTDTFFKEGVTSGITPGQAATNTGTAGVLPATTGGSAASGTVVSATAVVSGGLS